MASQQQAAAKKPEPPQADEQQLQEAFDHLNELHAQLRALRSAIPHMIAPLTAKQPSPEVLFKSFTNAVQESSIQLTEFRQTITNEKSLKVFKLATDSRRANPKGIKPWRARDDPDWLERTTLGTNTKSTK